MAVFGYRKGKYCAEKVSVRRIAQSCGTPFYCYSGLAIKAAYADYVAAFAACDALICYAIKANSNQSIIGLLGALGAGADVVSEGELRRAIAAGISGDKIVYSGVAKTATEIEFALRSNIRQFNVESEPELEQISAAAVRLGKKANVAFRINPDVDALTHEKISTGKVENKFGIPWQSAGKAYARAAAMPGINICGIDIHIGSQITQLEPYSLAFERVAEMVEQLRGDGHTISSIDLGGGLGIDYRNGAEPVPTPAQYAEVAMSKLGHLGCQFILEPGRSLVGAAGILVGRVIYVKRGSQTTFLIVDAAMNDFLRPSMYDAHHSISSESDRNEKSQVYDVVGPVCETGDTFGHERTLPQQSPGDLIIIEGAGAYGSVMASTYNTRCLVPEVLVDGNEFKVIRERPDYSDLIGLDVPWEPPDAG